PPVVFTDVTEKAGLHFRHVNGAFGKKWLPETMGGGGGFLDYDNDGWLDIVFVNGSYWPGSSPKPSAQRPTPTLALYHNNHDGTFTDVTKLAGLDVSLYGMGGAVGDYDNDGYDDLFITAVGQSKLFHNVPDGNGGRKFVEVTASSGIEDTGFATSAAWLDYDKDGKLDLFVCHYVKWTPQTDVYYSVDGVHKSYATPQAYQGESCRLYHNLGSGKFEDVTRRAGIWNQRSKALGVAICDYDNDGRPDIFVANDTEANFLFHNQGDGTFKEVGVESGIALSDQGKSRAGMGIDTADVRNNGQPDVLITNFAGEQLTLYRRDSSGLFLDVAARSGVGNATQMYLGFGAFFFDYDLDGWADLFVTNGHIMDDIDRRDAGVSYAEPSLLFHNQGQGMFADVSAQSGPALTTRRVGRGAAYGDYDNDGSPDILILTNGGKPALLRNNNHSGNGWIRLLLQGTESNRDAIGARLFVTVGDRTQMQEVRSGSSYLSASDRRVTFGLGTAAQADKVEIRWPSGKVQLLPGPLPRGTTRLVREGE
ncbi:MAG TPA: CRTAC1 family protein, partial [Chthonomonadaceae bacterium]|nr:CRTAC1 family protein [Chthonomonadaceae bacterium]